MSLVVIFGRKLREDGSPDEKYVSRLDIPDRLRLMGEKVEGIIISGGVTRNGFPSEARVGRDYLTNKGVDIGIRLEEKAMTTMENLARTEELLLGFRGRVLIVVSESSIDRVNCYCSWFFPHLYNRVDFIGAKGGRSFRDTSFNMAFKWLRKICSKI